MYCDIDKESSQAHSGLRMDTSACPEWEIFYFSNPSRCIQEFNVQAHSSQLSFNSHFPFELQTQIHYDVQSLIEPYHKKWITLNFPAYCASVSMYWYIKLQTGEHSLQIFSFGLLQTILTTIVNENQVWTMTNVYVMWYSATEDTWFTSQTCFVYEWVQQSFVRNNVSAYMSCQPYLCDGDRIWTLQHNIKIMNGGHL
jgi:hypothetical protein